MGNFLKMIFIIIGIVFIIWFAIPLLAKGIINIGNVTGIILGILFLAYGIWFFRFNEAVAYLWNKYLAAKIIEIFIGAVLLAIICLAVLCMASMGSAMKKTAAPDRTAVVLGCKVNAGGVPSLMLETRLLAAKKYLNENPESYVIVTGGQGKDEPVAEGAAMKEWLVGHGIFADRIYVDDRSLDTKENLKNALDIINADKEGKLSSDIVVITNEFHLYRALKMAEEAGFNAASVSADTPCWLFPTFYVREMYGILQYWFFNT